MYIRTRKRTHIKHSRKCDLYVCQWSIHCMQLIRVSTTFSLLFLFPNDLWYTRQFSKTITLIYTEIVNYDFIMWISWQFFMLLWQHHRGTLLCTDRSIDVYPMYFFLLLLSLSFSLSSFSDFMPIKPDWLCITLFTAWNKMACTYWHKADDD